MTTYTTESVKTNLDTPNDMQVGDIAIITAVTGWPKDWLNTIILKMSNGDFVTLGQLNNPTYKFRGYGWQQDSLKKLGIQILKPQDKVTLLV